LKTDAGSAGQLGIAFLKASKSRVFYAFAVLLAMLSAASCSLSEAEIALAGQEGKPDAVFTGDRVGGGLTPPVLSHHRTYGSIYGGS
jgi:hypothetical protein